MTNKYYQKHNKKLQKEAHKRYQNFSQDKKEKNKLRPKKDIKIFLNNKNYWSILEIII